MIDSKEKFVYYLKADAAKWGNEDRSLKKQIKDFFFPEYNKVFMRLMRRTEYYKNCGKGIIGKLFYLFYYYKFMKLSLKLGFSIPLNVFGPGLSIPHYGTIVVNGKAKIGANCRIHTSTNIGASGGKPEAPTLGDNIYVGPGAKIYGNIKIANGCVIGANAVVNKSFDEENILIAGNPAIKIKNL